MLAMGVSKCLWWVCGLAVGKRLMSRCTLRVRISVFFIPRHEHHSCRQQRFELRVTSQCRNSRHDTLLTSSGTNTSALPSHPNFLYERLGHYLSRDKSLALERSRKALTPV